MATILAGALLLNGCGEDSTSTPASPTPSTSLSQLTVTPSSVTGGEDAKGEVTLTAPASSSTYVVNITSSVSAVIVPATVTIPAGSTSTSFSMATQPVQAETSVTINALAGVETRTATLVVRPAAVPAVDRLQVDPSFEGGQSSTATVHLDRPASPSPIVVTLASDNPALVVPASVTVSVGTSAATFTMTSRVVSSETRVTVSASAGGQTRTAEVRVRPRELRPAGGESFFSFVSAAGDYIGQGRSGTYRPTDGRFVAFTCGRGQFVNIDVLANTSNAWSLQFGAPDREMTPGTYVHTNGFYTSGQPYLTISSPARACNQTFGRFVVSEVVHGSSGSIRRFRATFEQRCGSSSAPLLTGEIFLVDPPTDNLTIFC